MNNLPPRGTMRPVKKVLGVILGLIGLGLIIATESTQSYVEQYTSLFAVILLISSYFFIISGRRFRLNKN